MLASVLDAVWPDAMLACQEMQVTPRLPAAKLLLVDAQLVEVFKHAETS